MKEIWNSRYNKPEYIYGIKPNNYLKTFIETNNPGTILLPADGEGRNSVFAAIKGWQVDAFDYSESACIKALNLANKYNVIINYSTSEALHFKTKKEYDLIALIYFHLLSEERTLIFNHLITFLKPGGHILLEAFSKNQINNTSGGPKDIKLLYDLNDIKNDFAGLNIKELNEHEITLDEGLLHQGKANVIRLIAQKTSVSLIPKFQDL
ncbi:MAG: hypothetical protein A2W99_09820 [Bacteroidetes bacterium GWF2_33_16]|nr:MAG: hypothetical protein A2X00_06730 [Bacteroidetes bacterium GWE2_32_14]OFY07290.1 MAG: hypothetical protein A2W99_09820 [Bacteroidetes bacterium GWF2_33_16]